MITAARMLLALALLRVADWVAGDGALLPKADDDDDEGGRMCEACRQFLSDGAPHSMLDLEDGCVFCAARSAYHATLERDGLTGDTGTDVTIDSGEGWHPVIGARGKAIGRARPYRSDGGDGIPCMHANRNTHGPCLRPFPSLCFRAPNPCENCSKRCSERLRRQLESGPHAVAVAVAAERIEAGAAISIDPVTGRARPAAVNPHDVIGDITALRNRSIY